ncbi:MAG: hypothetical protein KBC96_12900 [Armatimonadetes bacterium]|nr:hypothetical protein [Armatimonadota bacterium]
MMGIPHVLAGAAVACAVKRPVLAVPAALASHLVLDYLPHLDAHGIYGQASGGWTGAELTMGLADLAVAVALIIRLVQRRNDWRLVILGAVCGVMIDLACNMPPCREWMQSMPVTASFAAFHHNIQHNVPCEQWPLGFSTQSVAVLVALVLLLRYQPEKKASRCE